MTEPDGEEATPLTAQQVADIKTKFERGEYCPHCRGIHNRHCPRVSRMAFHPNGALAGIWFWQEFNDDNVIWPEDVAATIPNPPPQRAITATEEVQ